MPAKIAAQLGAPMTGDHDTLVRIETIVIDLKYEMKELKDGTHSQLVDHENRLKQIENLILQIDPLRRIASGETMQQEWHDFKVRSRSYMTTIALAAGVIGSLCTTLLRVALDHVLK